MNLLSIQRGASCGCVQLRYDLGTRLTGSWASEHRTKYQSEVSAVRGTGTQWISWPMASWGRVHGERAPSECLGFTLRLDTIHLAGPRRTERGQQQGRFPYTSSQPRKRSCLLFTSLRSPRTCQMYRVQPEGKTKTERREVKSRHDRLRGWDDV
jgi:hypothetical protein